MVGSSLIQYMCWCAPKNSGFVTVISHQRRRYSSVKALCGLSYTCFTGTWVLGQFEETGPEYPKSCVGILKVIQSLQILISHQMRPYSGVKALCGLRPVSQIPGSWRNLGKLGPNTPNYV